MKRKSLALLLGAGLVGTTLIAGCGSDKSNSAEGDGLGSTLNVFNWSEYLPQSVIDKFEKQYNIKVNYSTFSSNEEMLAKLTAGGGEYDLTVASNYYIQPMIKEGLIEELDLNNIPNFKNLLPEYVNQDYDPGNKYSIPYMGNTVSLGINPDKIKVPITSYADLWNPALKNEIVLVDDVRFVLGMALKTLGYSANDTDEAHLEEAKRKLKELMPNVKAFDSDSPKTLMINGEVGIMFRWGAEVALAQRERTNVTTILPKEGLMMSFDTFVIPKGSKHKKAAEAFINFLLDPQISAEISESFPYINPNKGARDLIDKATLENIAIYPPDKELKRTEYIQDIGDKMQLFDRAWSEIKS